MQATRWRQSWRRWKRQWEPWLRTPRAILGWIPLTPRSALAIALLLWVYLVYGKERSDLVLLVVGLGGLALVALALVSVLLVALVMRLRKPPAPQDTWVFHTGLPFYTGYTLTLSAWIPLIQIEMDWTAPEGLEATLEPWRGRLREQVLARRRAVAEGFERRFTFTDAFGMARVSWRRFVPQPLKVMPVSSRLEPNRLLQQLSSGDIVSHPSGQPEGDLIEMRRYTHGDPLKRVLWKTYARTRRLLVRQPERAIAPRQKTLAYLVADRSDEPAAGTARTALEMGVFGHDFLFRADGSESSTDQVPEAVEQIVRSSRVTEDGGAGLASFLTAERAQDKACILFAPHSPGPWLERVEQQLHQYKGRISVVVGVDGIQGGGAPSLLRRALFADAERWEDTVAQLGEVCLRLRQAGAPVTILDRTTGMPVSPQHLQALNQRRQRGLAQRLLS